MSVTPPVESIESRIEAHRGELVGYCYRMLGCPFEAEDAVQECLVRAWTRRDSFDESKGSWRGWLFAIATNVCIDVLRGARRRMIATDMGPASSEGPDFETVLPYDRWVLPIPDAHLGDPGDRVLRSHDIRLAFVAALQHLPPRQRAVLILREVLSFPAAEVARQLSITPASVNSALQRARATLAKRFPDEPTARLTDGKQQQLLNDYVEAFESHDIDRLVTLLAEDATTSMPPVPWWVRGRELIGELMRSGDDCRGDRLVLTSANGQPAFGQYRHDGDRHRGFALVILDTCDGRIVSTTTYLGAEYLFPLFDLPLERRF